LIHLSRQKVCTVTVESIGSLSSSALDDLIQALLWEKTVTNADKKPVHVYRMKVRKIVFMLFLYFKFMLFFYFKFMLFFYFKFM